MYSSTNGVEKIYSDTKMAAQLKEKTSFFATNIIKKKLVYVEV